MTDRFRTQGDGQVVEEGGSPAEYHFRVTPGRNQDRTSGPVWGFIVASLLAGGQGDRRTSTGNFPGAREKPG